MLRKAEVYQYYIFITLYVADVIISHIIIIIIIYIIIIIIIILHDLWNMLELN